MVAAVSNESRASTSVETRPETIFRICSPNSTLRRSIALRTMASLLASAPASLRAQASASSTSGAYSFIWAAAMMSDGFVVASRGLYLRIALMSPVSETTTVIWESCSRKDAMCGG